MVLRLETQIRAPARRCFDLSRSIDLHVRSAAASGERAVAGTTSGLIALGEEVTWYARHFGVWQHLTSRITGFDPPRHFQDRMVRGAFRRFVHDHYFDEVEGGTWMRDEIDFAAPGGLLGRVVDRWLLRPYLERFIVERNEVIRRVAESDEWKDYLSG